jgi:hypothetical protein
MCHSGAEVVHVAVVAVRRRRVVLRVHVAVVARVLVQVAGGRGHEVGDRTDAGEAETAENVFI